MAVPNRVFLDSDIVLDHLADRQPFAECAHRIFALAETGKFRVCISALSFSNLYYILRKLIGHGETLLVLTKLKRLVRATAVSDLEIDSALRSRFKDFEDAIQHFSAKAEGSIDAIITRNLTDYAASELPVFLPEQFLAAHDAQSLSTASE